MNIIYPVYLIGNVVRGFRRGSRELGIPTANIDLNSALNLDNQLKGGIYYGFAQIVKKLKTNAEPADDTSNSPSYDSSPVYMMCCSLGHNPFYKNNSPSLEVHILHQFENSFYDSQLRVAICGRIRDEQEYANVTALVNDIKNDISLTQKELSHTKWEKVKSNDKFFILTKV